MYGNLLIITKKSPVILFFLYFFLMVVNTHANENDWFVPLGRPPKASPRRISGGESFPPLPLPATPLRRTERKRQPSPPKLVGKVVWGENATFAYKNGVSCQISDWNLCPSDIQQILGTTGKSLGLSYSSEPISLLSFHGDPEKTPVLFFSGVRSVKLDKPQIEALRNYVLRGGMIICDSIAGSPYFYSSVKKLMDSIFPEFSVRHVPEDHPIYHMVFDVDKVKYPRNLKSDKPFLEAIYVGCRIGVLISKYGLGCGWDHHEVPMLKKAVYYDVKSANKLGLNIMSYTVGYSNVGLTEAKPELFGVIDEKPPTDEFVFAQITHNGVWNVHPGAASALLRTLRHNTSVKVNLKRVPVTPGKDNLSGYTFLFLTGLDDFTFNEKAVTALKNFLSSSGTLFISNGLGMKKFDQAVRRELKKILPEASLEKIPLSHPIYNSAFKVQGVQYSPAVFKQHPKLNVPYLEGINLNGDLRIIYSPYDIEAGWLGISPPLMKGYAPHSAMQLGVNIIIYALTH